MKPLYELTREEGNALLEGARTFGLDPLDFDWSKVTVRGIQYKQWTHKPTGHSFRFSGWTRNDHSAHYTLQWSPVVEGRTESGSSSRNEIFDRAARWLRAVKKEHDTPDLWAALRQDQELLAGAATEGERPFSIRERELLSERLDQFGQQIKQLTTATVEQAAMVDATIETLKEAAETTTRSQWKLMVSGAILQTVFALALDPVRAQQVVHFAGIYLGPLFGYVRGLIGQ